MIYRLTNYNTANELIKQLLSRDILYQFPFNSDLPHKVLPSLKLEDEDFECPACQGKTETAFFPKPL